jgi:predicted nucleic acid-binding protein
VSWLLDSDVLSQPAKKAGNARVISWLEKHQDQCYTSSIVIAQLAFWVRTKRGKQRIALQKWLTDLIEAMQGRILGFNVSTAHVWAELQHQFQSAGKPMPVEDSYIAAIARRHKLTVATGNVKDFQRPGVRVFDPFTEPDET